jgi:hypothetical protein
MAVPPWLLALALVVALLVLIPARRLQLGGVRAGWIAAYAFGVWAGAMLLALMPGTVRILVPVLLVAYIAPFVAAPERVERILRRRPPDDRPPMKDVTPPDQHIEP